MLCKTLSMNSRLAARQALRGCCVVTLVIAAAAHAQKQGNGDARAQPDAWGAGAPASGPITINVRDISSAGVKSTSVKVNDASTSPALPPVQPANVHGQPVIPAKASAQPSTPLASGSAEPSNVSSQPVTPGKKKRQRHAKSSKSPTALKPVETSDTHIQHVTPVQVGGNRPASQIGELGLQQAVNLALERHPSISSAQALTAQADAQVLVAKSARWPVISYGVAPGYDASTGQNSNLQLSAGINQTLYDFGVTTGSINGAQARRDKQEHMVASAAETVAQQTSETFVEMVAAQEVMAAADREAKALDEIRLKIERRVKAGMADVSDLKRADVSRERAVADRLQAQTRFNVAADTLAQIIGVRATNVVGMTATSDVIQGLGSRSDSVEAAPALLAARSAAAAADADLVAAKGRRYPSVGVGVTQYTSRVHSTFSPDTQFGLVLHGSFELGRGAAYQVEAANAALEAAEHDIEYQRLTAETALASADLGMAGARAQVAAYDRMMKLWADSRDLYWQEYLLNKRSLSDVFNMESDIFAADSQRIEAVRQSLVATLRAHAATGTLVDRLRGSGR